MILDLATCTPLVVPPPCVGSPLQTPRSLWEGLGSFRCLFAVVLPLWTRPSPFLGSGSENWLWGQTWMRELDLLMGQLPLASVSFWIVPWLVAHPLSPRRPRCIDHMPCSVGSASWVAAALILAPGSWPLSATPRPLLQSLSSGDRGRGVSSVSSITSPGEPRLCCTMTSLSWTAGQ